MKVCVVGGGPAGMMAAIMAGRNGHRVTVIEKNEKLGKKLYITGKGRCNLTNDCDKDTFFDNVISNPRFLYSAYSFMDTKKLEAFFEELGLKLKVERGNRVFPASDHSSDVTGALKREMDRLGITVIYNTRVRNLVLDNTEFTGIITDKGEEISAEGLILCVGGSSYQSTGSNGESLIFSEMLGLKHVKPEPSLVPLVTKERFVKDLQGLALKNIKISVYRDKKKIFEDQGELLFTHFGVSGPLILSASCHLKEEDYKKDIRLVLDLKPALDEKKLDERILSDLSKYRNKQFGNSLKDLLPSSMIPVFVDLSGIDPQKKVNSITKCEREKLLRLFKGFELKITGNRGFDEAIITRGGISTKEIDPGSMRLKKYENIYAAGEMIDLDAYTGGFNLQIAWSTGALAGNSI
ncbi:MAG: NAD(P)/FAD-dependent oxidoreductase [Lachnospiraceae bacterium]|nr:NAD(P)/FAD-dependent oxidoreductase [Lachnospiraceae bacterium]